MIKLLLLFVFINVGCAQRTINIDVVYHFLYDSRNLNIQYLQYDLKSVKEAHLAANKEFEGHINLNYSEDIQTHTCDLSLSDVFNNYFYGDRTKWLKIISNWSILGKLNVYVMRTETIEGNILLGFVPHDNEIHPELYNLLSPLYDNVFVSYSGLFEFNSGSTLVHEIGHLFSLKHPWFPDMTPEELILHGLTSPSIICVNNMNYNCYVESFTPEQLNIMKEFILKYRINLIKKH